MAHPQIIMNDSTTIPLFSGNIPASSPIVDPYQMQTVAIQNEGDKTIFRYQQPIGDILNNNEIERAEGINDKGEFRKVASVPFVIWTLWENSGITNDPKELRRALERHRNELKTTEKRLI